MYSSIYELVRKAEQSYVFTKTTNSKYVDKSMYEDLQTVDAYINSKHISGPTDSLGREKPFFNIVTAARNIWYRATDIDRKNIRLKPARRDQTVATFVANVHLQNWMRKENFGAFLNDWGRSLATYGSSVLKFVEVEGSLHMLVMPWNRLIVDAIDFNANPVIEKLYLTPYQLQQRKGYNQEMVKKLLEATVARRDLNKQKKDLKNDYIEVYEIHGTLPVSFKTGNPDDKDEYRQQMHVISFLATNEKKNEYENFTLASGFEEKHPYMITHLIEEEGQTLSIGAVQNLFEAQWMLNHTAKNIKDQLDLASKIIFQTSDGNFIGQNALSNIEQGDVLVHSPNAPITEIANSSHDITSLQAYGQQWKALGNEINGISESMLGAQPPSGTAWRQTQALLQESHSLFEIMTENKGLYLEEILREHIIPYFKKTQLKHSKEIVATLDAQGISQFDQMYIPNEAVRINNEHIKSQLLHPDFGHPDTPPAQALDPQQVQGQISQSLQQNGNQRFLKPSDLADKQWKDIFKDLEWEIEIDITGEDTPDKEDLATLNTVLQTIATNPRVLLDPNAKMIFNKILSTTGAVSSLQLVEAQPFMPMPTKKFLETLNYKDAPEDIKRQMEEQAGLQPSQTQQQPIGGGSPVAQPVAQGTPGR